MNKKIIFSSIIAFTLSVSLTFNSAAHAEEGIMPISDTSETPIEGTVSPDDVDSINPINPNETPIAPEPDNTTEPTEPEPESPDYTDPSDSELDEDAIHNGTSGEPEVVCADPNEPGCEDEALDPEIWPLILSLSALGMTIIFIIIINLIGHRKK